MRCVLRVSSPLTFVFQSQIEKRERPQSIDHSHLSQCTHRQVNPDRDTPPHSSVRLTVTLALMVVYRVELIWTCILIFESI